jgi:ubiquitin thioesterase protein OTUB1
VQRYPGIRRVRGDGSCFYRALLFSYTTSLVKGRLAGGDSAAAAEAAWKDLLTIAKDSKEWLLSVGYNDTAIDTFYEVCCVSNEDPTGVQKLSA